MPIFKNTMEALQYGKSIKDKPYLINLLKEKRKHYVKVANKLLDKGQLNQALLLGSGQSQFTREAIEEAERVI